MKRRDFIKLSVNAAICLAIGGATTANAATNTPRTVIDLMLDGGPDFRHLIVPPFTTASNSYAAAYWRARASIFRSTPDNTTKLRQAYRDNYDEVVYKGVRFGILKSCAWLKSEILKGNVAIFSNVFASTNRDHSHSKLMLESGSLETGPLETEISGWGGRSAAELNSNVVAMTQGVRVVCNAPDPLGIKGYDNSRVISNYDSRNFGLYNYDTQSDLDNKVGNKSIYWSSNALLSRSLTSYYSAKDSEIPASSPYRKFIDHEKKFRKFGGRVQNRLKSNALPNSIESLYTGNSSLNSKYFGKQIRNLYDSFVVQDILQMRFASLEYKGWDSHRQQLSSLEAKFGDLFGRNRGLDTLIQQLNRLNSNIYNNSVFVVSGEFGRQLKSNSDNGTDHGRGNNMIVIGSSVNGGFYGDLFPQEETNALEVKNKDIEGKTSMFQVYARVLDWQQSGLGSKVFDLGNKPIESGLKLASLLKR